MNTETPSAKPCVKNIKHVFTVEERNALGMDISRTFADRRGIESEFDQVKQSYKSKLSERDARIETISTAMINGFDMRNANCVQVLFPEAKKKCFFLEVDWDAMVKNHTSLEALQPVGIEDMTPADFQQDLIEAESKFEKREEINLFQATERDHGVLVVGMFNSRWYSALRVSVGKYAINERLDSEQKSFKRRYDAIAKAGRRAIEWFRAEMPKDAKGFEDPILSAVSAHQEREE